MSKLPNYLSLYWKFFKKTFDIKLFLALNGLPILWTFVKGGEPIHFFFAKPLIAVFEFLQLEDLFKLLNIDNFTGGVIGISIFSIYFYCLVIFFVFVIIELRYLPYRLKGFTTKEIDIALAEKQKKWYKKDDNDY